MCSATDDPTTYHTVATAPRRCSEYTGPYRQCQLVDGHEGTHVFPVEPVMSPRRYVLAGSEEPQASVALAVLGTMLTEAESDLRVVENSKTGATTVAMARVAVDALRRARNKVADAEARR